MKIIKLNITLIILLLLVLSGGSRVFGAHKINSDLLVDSTIVELKQISSVDLCGVQDDKKVYLAIDLGDIYVSDSLFGFNFQIFYNPDKIRFNTVLYINTLSEYMSSRDINFSIPGQIIGYAGNLTGNPISGSKALIAFMGDYIGLCPDTAVVNLSYLEFTEEFKKKVSVQKPGIITSEIFDNENRLLNINFNYNQLELKDDSTSSVVVNMQADSGARIEDVIISITKPESDYFEMKDFISTNPNFNITQIEDSTREYRIRAKINNIISNSEIFGFNLVSKIKYDTSSKIIITPVSAGDCACITRLKGDSMKVVIKNTSVSQNEETDYLNIVKYYYKPINEEFRIECSGKGIEEIDIYDIHGNKLIHKDFSSELYVNITLQDLRNGIYLMTIRRSNHEINRIKIIKY